jgi:hypothetical protein
MLIRDSADSEIGYCVIEGNLPKSNSQPGKNSPGQTFETAEGTGKQVKTSMREAAHP